MDALLSLFKPYPTTQTTTEVQSKFSYWNKKFSGLTEEIWEKKIQKDPIPSKFFVVKYLKHSFFIAYEKIIILVDKIRVWALSHFLFNIALKYSWWNEISEATAPQSLYLGAIPLSQKILFFKIRDDLEDIANRGVGAVLSVVEPYEMDYSGLTMSPIKVRDWKMAGIRHLQLSSPDFRTIKMKKIIKGVEFIRWNILNNRSVYVHCKGGKGRSALVTICYLIKYENKTVEEAHDYVRNCRPQIHLRKNQIESVKAYFTYLKNSIEPETTH